METGVRKLGLDPSKHVNRGKKRTLGSGELLTIYSDSCVLVSSMSGEGRRVKANPDECQCVSEVLEPNLETSNLFLFSPFRSPYA